MFRTLGFIFLLLSGLVAAQFPFFNNMFNQQHQEQQRPSGASQWASHLESVSCNQYLCPATLDCVKTPVDCPCPDVEDIKCLIPDADPNEDGATVVCVRGENECAEVERLAGIGRYQK